MKSTTATAKGEVVQLDSSRHRPLSWSRDGRGWRLSKIASEAHEHRVADSTPALVQCPGEREFDAKNRTMSSFTLRVASILGRYPYLTDLLECRQIMRTEGL